MNEDSARTSLEKQPTAARPQAPAAEADVRASDADRDRVADILREALAEGRLDAEEHGERVGAVYAAKTVGELEPIVRDLPAGREDERKREQPRAEPDSYAAAFSTFAASYASSHTSVHGRCPWSGPKENMVAIFSSSARKGRWRVPRKINAFACFGSVEIDLTQALFDHQHVHINATSVFGSIDIRVPENITLQQKGAGIFGGFDVHVADSPEADAPVVLVQGAAVFGSVEAKPKRGKLIHDLRERFRKER
ncbi:DUF1707 SHOCT-like domain-containing protein [Streptomyces iconiensis]|uniref:DUF1707 domain-containing protein n=1 Tax=Streptomyces iconiensis TaxID=1384038 RepID=A0ABT7A0R3_9ACTN|nr:DUF1707 domain-containing protein [Streptomyces iconiensis]MDJ1134649.1 DUF1707 domain-containing protein [Streptomyces iconiensis]